MRGAVGFQFSVFSFQFSVLGYQLFASGGSLVIDFWLVCPRALCHTVFSSSLIAHTSLLIPHHPSSDFLLEVR